ncbi:MAG TPA: potassium transporter TrkG [Micromonosporaceae bacterium]
MPHRTPLRHPARLVPLAFLAVMAVGTGLLALPAAKAGPGSAPLITALFTATSAVCVTGLTTVDTATYWSPFGQAVILVLFQIGGFGVMSLGALLGLLVYRRLGLTTRLVAQAETRTLALGEVRSVLWRIALTVVAFEAVTTVLLSARFWLGYGMNATTAAWHGLFHSVSAFNNAGFSLNTDSLMGYVADPWVNLPVILAIIFGGLGFPVLLELRRRLTEPSRWSTHTRITVWATVILLLGGTLAVLALEWSNPSTLGRLATPDKVLASLFQSVTARTAGFNTIDTSALGPGTLAVLDGLMFIGGGSAGTAGGIKVTTFFLLGFVIWSELRGEPDVNVHRRRLGPGPQRQALTVALLGVAFVGLGTLALLILTGQSLDRVLFESVSAFATVGMSTGITPGFDTTPQLVLITLMFVGRVGPMTIGAALALRSRRQLYRLPEARPIVG